MNQFDERVRCARLTKTQRRIAEYISENYNNVCFLKSSDIAVQVQASPSSVVNLAKVLNYDSFEDMKLKIREDVFSLDSEKPHTAESFLSKRLASSISELGCDDPLKVYYKKTQSVVDSVFSRNDPDKFLKAKEIMLNSHTIYVAGFSGCRGIADQFSILMRRIFSRVITLIHADSDAVTQMANVSPKDCLILFSYERYANMSFKMNQIARNFGAKIIVITDKISAPVAEGADIIFVTEKENGTFFNSAVGPVMISELLAFLVSPEQANITQRRLDMIDTFVATEELY
ncbi:MAG: MurR/RpiR family transcriptional regulator [Lawsonibacter sp.]|jgi:DNA-binding MurR/RpiR family transcriptional regulator